MVMYPTHKDYARTRDPWLRRAQRYYRGLARRLRFGMLGMLGMRGMRGTLLVDFVAECVKRNAHKRAESVFSGEAF